MPGANAGVTVPGCQASPCIAANVDHSVAKFNGATLDLDTMLTHFILPLLGGLKTLS